MEQFHAGTVVNLVVSSGPCSRIISGHITEPDAVTPVGGVLVQAGGVSNTTDANGYYALAVTYGWSGTVTLSKTGYMFDPDGMEYSNVTTNLTDDYTAILKTFIISGYVVDSKTQQLLAGVLVSPDSNGGSFTTKYYGGGSSTTNTYGYYTVLVDYNWSGNVVTSKEAYGFLPSSMAYTNVIEDKTAAQNFVGTLLTYKITGHIKNACDVPIAGILVIANNGGGSDTTDVNGYYEVGTTYNWSGKVTPSKAFYTFDPNSKVYINVLADKTGQDYLAANIYDLDCNGYIGWGDVAIMGQNWLANGPGLLGDFDKNNTVNFLDFADFADVWITEFGK